MATTTSRGRIALEYHISCGWCENWDFIEAAKVMTKKQIKEWAESEGWTMTRKFGWTCLSCAKKRKRFEKKYLTQEE